MSENQNKPEGNERNQDSFWGDKSLMELLNRTITLQRRYMHHKMHSHHHRDPNRGQSRILSILKIKPEISQKDLSYLLDMRSQSLGELLMKLERVNYITRKPSDEDHRAMMITLTDLGRDAAEQAEKSQADSGQLFDCLSAEEQTNLSDYLKRLIIRMDQEMTASHEDKSYDYDPFWGVGDYKDEVKEYCHRAKHAAKEHSRAIHKHMREQGRALRDEIREQGRALHDEFPHDPRLKGFFWGSCGHDHRPGECERHCENECRGNGPRP